VVRGVAGSYRCCIEGRIVKSKTVRIVSLADGAKLRTGGLEQVDDSRFGSTCRTRSEIAKRLGWCPRARVEAWERGFVEEISALSKL
jgi:hypothetical protein